MKVKQIMTRRNALFVLFLAIANVMGSDKNDGIGFSAGFEAGADSLSLIYFDGAYYLGNANLFNDLEVKYSTELFHFFITDHPTVKKIGIFAGHQFRPRWRYLILPATIGISGGAGIDRGAFQKSNRKDTTCFVFCGSDDFYEKRHYISGGFFLDLRPSIYVNGYHFGLKFRANFDTRYMEYGGGLNFNAPL